MSNGWSKPLIEMSVPLALGIAGGWSNPLAEISIPLEPSEVIVAGWKTVSEMTVTLKPPTMECLTDADCPEGYVCVNGMCVRKEAGVPWVPFAVGGAVAVTAIIIYAGSRKKGEETKK
jgi:Cys-rich repeat protein